MTGQPELDEAVLGEIEARLGRQTLTEIIDLFLDSARQRARIVAGAEKATDLTVAAAALHSIKSSAAMLGATRLFMIAEEMERMANRDERHSVIALIGDFENALSAAELALRVRMKKAGS